MSDLFAFVRTYLKKQEHCVWAVWSFGMDQGERMSMKLFMGTKCSQDDVNMDFIRADFKCVFLEDIRHAFVADVKSRVTCKHPMKLR